MIHDAKARENARIELQNLEGDLSFVEDVYDATNGSHALVLVIQWDEYHNLDYEKIYQAMAEPAFIFDGRNHLDHDKLYKIGFNVFPLGKPPLKHI